MYRARYLEKLSRVAFYLTTMQCILNTRFMDIPAKISDDVVAVMRQKMQKQFRAIGGLGLYLVDFFYTDNREIFFSKLSIPPQVLQWSMYPHYFGTIWGSYPGLIERVWYTLPRKALTSAKRI